MNTLTPQDVIIKEINISFLSFVPLEKQVEITNFSPFNFSVRADITYTNVSGKTVSRQITSYPALTENQIKSIDDFKRICLVYITQQEIE